MERKANVCTQIVEKYPILFNFNYSTFLAFLISIFASLLAKLFTLLISSSSLGSRLILPETRRRRTAQIRLARRHEEGCAETLGDADGELEGPGELVPA